MFFFSRSAESDKIIQTATQSWFYIKPDRSQGMDFVYLLYWSGWDSEILKKKHEF